MTLKSARKEAGTAKKKPPIFLAPNLTHPSLQTATRLWATRAMTGTRQRRTVLSTMTMKTKTMKMMTTRRQRQQRQLQRRRRQPRPRTWLLLRRRWARRSPRRAAAPSPRPSSCCGARRGRRGALRARPRRGSGRRQTRPAECCTRTPLGARGGGRRNERDTGGALRVQLPRRHNRQPGTKKSHALDRKHGGRFPRLPTSPRGPFSFSLPLASFKASSSCEHTSTSYAVLPSGCVCEGA